MVKENEIDPGTPQNPSSPGLSGRPNLADAEEAKWLARMKRAMTIV
jgi:hypothetical protein